MKHEKINQLNSRTDFLNLISRDGHRPEVEPKSGPEFDQFGHLNQGLVNMSPPCFATQFSLGIGVSMSLPHVCPEQVQFSLELWLRVQFRCHFGSHLAHEPEPQDEKPGLCTSLISFEFDQQTECG